ncbi:MAG: HAMP domain-containing histidine kinase [Muribaculaceae bacterium]|nr:HAMP domain-containing histidine kinase [Muribaculaceae bacterium]
MTIFVATSVFLVIIIILIWIYRHQCLLRDRASLMRDAMRHRDFAFRLPTKGLLFGEKAMQKALNDMGQEIEKLEAHNEVESWQRLTRVLTHEIMNATTPIRSISQAYLSNPDIKDTPYEEGIQAIYDTSSGLASFVTSYRKMTQLQDPVIKDLDINIFCQSISSLYSELNWDIKVPLSVKWKVDDNMLRQVFINLTKNAIEADAKSIGIEYVENQDALLISNDGHSIPDDVAREIFIPFFTTKHSGSGIGLSLSRQLLLKQGLILRLSEYPKRGYNVTFVLEKDRT